MNKKTTESRSSNMTEALEMYVKAIHELELKTGAAAPSDIAERLQVRAPSVTSALQKLNSLGMVKYQRYQHVNLTNKGREVAEMLFWRHRTLLEFLIRIGVDEEVATSDACEIEHVVHRQTIEKLASHLDEIKK